MASTRKDWTGACRKIVQPTLVIHGTDDPVLPLPNGEAIAQALPNTRMLALEGVGHELPDSIINKFADAVADHCRKA